MQYKLFKSANVLIHCSARGTHNSQVFLQPIYNPQRKNILSTYASDVGADNKSRAVILSESCRSPAVPLSVLVHAESHTAWQPEEDHSSRVLAGTNQQLDSSEKPRQELG